MSLPYWNHSGELHNLEAYPESFGEWELGQEIPAKLWGLHTEAEKILSQAIVRTQCKAMDMNITLDATLDDGTSVILRKRHEYASDATSENWSLKKFENELTLIGWLRKHSKIPVPEVISVGPNFSIQKKMLGSSLYRQWHSFSPRSKERFMSDYVSTVLDIFHLPDMPQNIGCASVNAAGVMKSTPFLGSSPGRSSSKIFETIHEYFDFLIALKRGIIVAMKSDDQERAERNLSFVENKARFILDGVTDPALLLCALTHVDLHNSNILASEDGTLTAVLDWEINIIQPAILAAGYPLWLHDFGTEDPRFAADSTWWEVSPDERSQMRALFEEMVKGQDPLYHRCLTEGHHLRQIVGWMVNHHLDPGFDRMRSWANSELSKIPFHHDIGT